MMQVKLENSPIVYYVSKCEGKEWVLFLHAAFVNHKMFQTQIDYFKDKFNIIAVDIIGHGQSTDTRKGDSIDKMSAWLKQTILNEKIDKVHLLGVSLGAVLVQDFANLYPDMVKSLACFGGYDVNNFDTKMQKDNSASQMLMMLKAVLSIKWFAKANKRISAYTEDAQNEFYEMNIQFPKKSFMHLASLNNMVNKHQTQKRNYPLLIGCGEYDVPMELSAVKMWKDTEPNCMMTVFKRAGHCVNMDAPQVFNMTMESFWTNGEVEFQNAIFCPPFPRYST